MKRHPSTESSAVTAVLKLALVGLDGATRTVRGELSYGAHDPYAVKLVLVAGRSMVTWTMGRDLLAQGLLEPSGEGDVHVFPELDHRGRPVVALELCSPHGSALLEGSTKEFLDFLAQTYQVVAPGAESAHIDFDAGLARLLEAGAA